MPRLVVAMAGRRGFEEAADTLPADRGFFRQPDDQRTFACTMDDLAAPERVVSVTRSLDGLLKSQRRPARPRRKGGPGSPAGPFSVSTRHGW